MDRECDFEARVTLISDHPKVVGYFPQFHYPGDESSDYLIPFEECRSEDGHVLQRGDGLPKVFIGMFRVLSSEFRDLHRARLRVGVRFELREGSRVTATGEVTRLVGLL